MGVEDAGMSKVPLFCQEMGMTFYEWVKVTRLAQDRSLEEVAVLAQTSKGHLWGIEQGRHDPSLRLAENIANALDYELHEALVAASRG